MVRSWKLVAVMVAGIAGCGGGVDEEKGVVPPGKVPSVAVKAAAKKFPDVGFDAVTREKVSGKEIYEMKGKDKKGKAHTIRVTGTGDVLSSD